MMRTFFQDPLSRWSAKLPRRSRPNPRRRAELAEVARSRLRAAALHGDPFAAEAASRAYAVAVNLALLDELARAIGARLRLAWRSLRADRARRASITDLDP